MGLGCHAKHASAFRVRRSAFSERPTAAHCNTRPNGGDRDGDTTAADRAAEPQTTPANLYADQDGNHNQDTYPDSDCHAHIDADTNIGADL